MSQINPNELRKRQINANAYALESLAAFARYRTSLPLELPANERVRLLEQWATTVNLVVGEQIEELEAYEQTGAVYDSEVLDFIINMASLSFLEIKSVVSPEVLTKLLAESCGKRLLLAALRKCEADGDSPEPPDFLERQDAGG